jgi:peptide/nickel transport system substrate-binding protein
VVKEFIVKKHIWLSAFVLGLGVIMAAPRDAYIEFTGNPPVTLDPSQAYDGPSGQFLENVYETLLTYRGSDMKTLEPLLATAYQPSDEGRTWTFTLRQGVKFQDGEAFTCADAVYTFRRALIVNNPGSWGGAILGSSLLGTASNAKDDPSITWARLETAVSCDASGRLVFRLPEPDASFPYRVAFMSAGIVSQKFAAQNGEWSGTVRDWKDWIGRDLQATNGALHNKMMGTGAYQLESRTDDRATFKAFPGYWGGAPKLARVELRVVRDAAAHLEALKTGEADLALVGRRSLEALKTTAGVTVVENLPNLNIAAVFFNQRIQDPALLGSGKLDGQGVPANFFSDLDVRQGFVNAFDHDRFILEALGGQGKRLTMAMPESFFGYDANLPVPKFDLEAATAHLKRAWGGAVWQHGFTVTAFVTGGVNQRAFEILKAGVEAINPKFKLIVQPVPISQLIPAQASGKLMMTIGSWTPDYPDPDGFIPNFYGSSKLGGYYANTTGLNDADFDRLLLEARRTTDQMKRAALYAQVGRLGLERAPFIVLPISSGILAHRSELRGVTVNPMLAGLYHWKYLSK